MSCLASVWLVFGGWPARGTPPYFRLLLRGTWFSGIGEFSGTASLPKLREPPARGAGHRSSRSACERSVERMETSRKDVDRKASSTPEVWVVHAW